VFASVLNQVGEWNPQLFRELKGRLTKRNMAIATLFSIAFQSILLLVFFSKLPTKFPSERSLWLGADRGRIYRSVHRYCTESLAQLPYDGDIYECVTNATGKVVINWSQWWSEIFAFLTIAVSIGVLVLSTYTIISDRSTEERQGTFNFVRLSPQSATTISVGKLLGVPCLVYLVALLALPLHWVSGLAAGIPIASILGVYIWFVAIATLLLSGALLFGAAAAWLGNLQPWIGSFVTLVTVWTASSKYVEGTAFDLLNLFSPKWMLYHAIATTDVHPPPDMAHIEIDRIQFFSISIGDSAMASLVISIVVFGGATYWIWKGLHRCFFTPEASLWRKTDTYLVIASADVLFLGFSIQYDAPFNSDIYLHLIVTHLLVFLIAIAALTPQRQTLYDWARFRHLQRRDPNTKTRSLLKDLFLSEKSPALPVITANVAMATVLLLPGALFNYNVSPWEGGISLLAASNLILIYAAIFQLMLMLKTSKRMVWAWGMVMGSIIAPPLLLSAFPGSSSGVWLFAVFPVFTEYAFNAEIAVAAQWFVFGLLCLKLTRQLRKAGTSETKEQFKEMTVKP